MPTNPALCASALAVNFGGVRALRDVDLEVPRGHLVGLIGPNGAGKTTFIDAISGFTPCRGRVWLDGREVSGRPPHDRARLGLARTWQSIDLFDDLSVGENLAVAAARRSVWGTAREVFAPRTTVDDATAELLALFGLEATMGALPNELSQGQRKLVGVARALAGKPQIICLDEPAAGLDTRESEALGRTLREIVDGGTSMLLVDHDMGLVLGISDHVVVLEFGKVIARGRPEEVRRNPDVITAYLGGASKEHVEIAS